jgi:hypothetical protein
MIYWLFTGKDFLGDRLNRIYAKWILPILFLFIMSCEKDGNKYLTYECKECTSMINYPEECITVFVCGEELKKWELNKNAICITPNSKRDEKSNKRIKGTNGHDNKSESFGF